jgi:acetyl-CoA decarbonylase/synthase complex subunit delta
VLDSLPADFPEAVKEEFGDAINDPVSWAKKCVEFGAEGLCLKLVSTNPEGDGGSNEDAVNTLKAVLEAVGVPLIVYGSGHNENDTKLMEMVSEAGKGERLLLGAAEEDWYKSIAVASMANGHCVIGFSNIDINLAKQIVILLKDFGIDLGNIVMDPLQAALGVGLEYSYSIIERIRLAALMGDNLLQAPIICDLSLAWAAPDVNEVGDRLGEPTKRGIEWEADTGMAALVAGAELLVVHSPSVLQRMKQAVDELYPGGGE